MLSNTADRAAFPRTLPYAARSDGSRPSAVTRFEWNDGITVASGNQGPFVFLMTGLTAPPLLRFLFARLRFRVWMLRARRQRRILWRFPERLTPLTSCQPSGKVIRSCSHATSWLRPTARSLLLRVEHLLLLAIDLVNVLHVHCLVVCLDVREVTYRLFPVPVIHGIGPDKFTILDTHDGLAISPR